jgi:hypothetical protein
MIGIHCQVQIAMLLALATGVAWAETPRAINGTIAGTWICLSGAVHHGTRALDPSLGA